MESVILNIIIHLDLKPKIDDFLFFLILYFSDLTPVFYPTYLLCFERKSCFSDVLKMYCVDLAAFRKNLNCQHTWSQDYRVADHNGGNIFWMRILMSFLIIIWSRLPLIQFQKNNSNDLKYHLSFFSFCNIKDSMLCRASFGHLLQEIQTVHWWKYFRRILLVSKTFPGFPSLSSEVLPF